MVIKQLFAAVSYYNTKNTLQRWTKNDGPANKIEFISELSVAHETLSIANTEPVYLDALANVMSWGIYKGFIEREDKAKDIQATYLNSLKLRPTWPVTWANLAVLKLNDGKWDSDFFTYLHKANQLGQTKDEVHILFLEFGLLLYKSRDVRFVKYRDDIIWHTSQALNKPSVRDRAFKRIDELNMTAEVCDWFELSENKYVFKLLRCQWL